MIKNIKVIPKPTFFGENLKLLRLFHGLSQTQLSKKVNLTRNNIASYEGGTVEPTAENFLKFCALFNILPHDFLHGRITEEQLDVSIRKPSARVSKIGSELETNIKSLAVQNSEMEKILQGYSAFFSIRDFKPHDVEEKQLFQRLLDTKEIFHNLIDSNWQFIKSIHEEEEEE